MQVRRAVSNDAATLAAIYNHSVINERNSTFETAPRTEEDRRQWIEGQGEHHPILVGEMNGAVIGWASVSPYRSRQCYQGVGEFSIYLHEDYRGKGFGKQLLVSLVEVCTKLGYWKLVSRIFDFNHASRKLCQSCGFREVGVYEKHGKLDGRWIDCVIVERVIQENLD
ncbi:N-acetyltransferase family protein [Paenibacillus sp. WST5]|uniref:N-acetyltransferase family protein n=1 Tax=Paenibacillus sedimenti TaxID=2770274 RepID=A0A926KQH3_9BACL|nr:N-acetyltransferase family protein [Paenibacillus sedimenti]